MPKHAFTVPAFAAAILVAAFFLPGSAAAGPAALLPLPRQIYLPLVFSPAVPPRPGTTSDDLIDAALKRGEINAETALTYKVFSAFNDPRLPGKYRGDDSALIESMILADVQAAYPGLSASTQATLNPFLLPPAYEGSWVEPVVTAAAVPSVTPRTTPPACGKIALSHWSHRDGSHVRVWWHTDHPGDAAAAQAYLTAMDGTIWPKLTGLMRAPLSDAGVTCSGGDGRFDIYLEPTETRAYAADHNEPSCKHTPSYIVLRPAASDAILAHEFMHAIQWGYKTHDSCMAPGEYAWMAEATATWAQDFVYPASDEEHRTADWFFSDNDTPSLELQNDSHEYGAYLYFFFLTRNSGDNRLVSRAWDNTEGADSLEAINQAIPGGFGADWARFARYNWNVPPFDFYKQWDRLTVQAKPLHGADTITGASVLPMTSATPHLGLVYKHYKFNGDNARLVTFFNGLTFKLSQVAIDSMAGITRLNDGSLVYKMDQLPPDQVKGAKVQALFKIAGETDWRLEDWTNKDHVSFCRDASTERLEELVIIFSNSEYKPRTYQVEPQDLGPTLVVSDIGCWRFKGSVTATMSGTGSGSSFVDTQTVPDAVFQRSDAHPDIPYPYLTFQVYGGKWHRDYKVSGKCTGGGTEDLVLPAGGTVLNNLWTLPGVVSGPSERRYLGYADTHQPVQIDVTCPDGSKSGTVQSFPWFEPSLLDPVLHKQYTVPEAGDLTGDDKLPTGPDALIRYQWNLTPQREP